MREADQNPFEATQVQGELTHHAYTHVQLVYISLEAIDKFMRMMGTFGWTARSGVSTTPATYAYCSACEEYSPHQQSILSVAQLRCNCHERTLLIQAGFRPIHTLLVIYPVYWDAIVTGCQVNQFIPFYFRRNLGHLWCG